MATPDWHLQHRTISNFHGASCQSTSNSFVWEKNSNKKPMQKLQTQKKKRKGKEYKIHMVEFSIMIQVHTSLYQRRKGHIFNNDKIIIKKKITFRIT